MIFILGTLKTDMVYSCLTEPGDIFTGYRELFKESPLMM